MIDTRRVSSFEFAFRIIHNHWHSISLTTVGSDRMSPVLSRSGVSLGGPPGVLEGLPGGPWKKRIIIITPSMYRVVNHLNNTRRYYIAFYVHGFSNSWCNLVFAKRKTLSTQRSAV